MNAAIGRECPRIHGRFAKIIAALQIWKLLANGIEKSICLWIKQSTDTM